VTFFGAALAALVLAGGWVAWQRTRRVRSDGGLSDDDIDAIERSGRIELRDPLDLDAIADAERRHREQTWDWADPDEGPDWR
jgi:hypothetical protein